MAVQRDDNQLLKVYTCSACTWPGAIKFPTDRLASGHAKATGHDVQAFIALTRTWVHFDEPCDSSRSPAPTARPG